MAAAAVVPVVLGILETVGPWLVKLSVLAIGTVAVSVFLRTFQTNRAHTITHKAVRTAHNALLAIYDDLRPMFKAPLEVYARYAAGRGVFPTEDDSNIHILNRRPFISCAQEPVPIRPVISHAQEPVPVVVGVPNAAQAVARPQNLKVTNNTSAIMQLTCKESPHFECFLKKSHTFTLPDNVQSPATIMVQGYLEDFSIVKLVHHIDFHQTPHVSIEDVKGSVQMISCVA